MTYEDRALKKLGNRIKKFRLEHRFSQEGFAVEAGLARSYYGGVERGERNLSFKTLVKIAKKLNLTVSDLCQGI